MSTRTSSIGAALLLLAACGSDAADDAAVAAVDDADLIECATGGAASFARNCAIERAEVDSASILVVRHPDGHFRRFELVDGSIATADGADAAQIASRGDDIEVRVGADRYRFPAGALGDAGE